MKPRKLPFLLCLILLASACGDPIEPEPVKLVAQPASLTFEAQGGTLDLTLTSGIKPTVSCPDSWIRLTEGSYANNSFKLTVTAQPYSGTDERSTNLRVIGDSAWLIGKSSVDAALFNSSRRSWNLQMKLCLKNIGGQWRFTEGRVSTFS